MRKTRRVTIILVVLGLTRVLLGTAHGTTFVVMDEEKLLESSDAVIVGTVTGIESAENSGGAIQTYVHVQPSRVIKGQLDTQPLVIREPGGTFGERTEWIYGAPEFWVGERSLLFLSRNGDGTLQTNGLSMGKFTLSVDVGGRSTALREFGHGASVFDPATGQIREALPETHAFVPLLSRLRSLSQQQTTNGARAPLVLRPQELDSTPTEVHESFAFLGSPSRWFEPDSGLAVPYYIDATGDAKLGFDSSRAAVDAALAAWTNVSTASLILVDGGTTSPGSFSQCSINRIVFNDPYNEIPNPSGCSGVLAMGGYCTSGATTVVNGTTFHRIVTGKVTFNDGWSGCGGWNQCNVAEVATHEIGHTIGFGHSSDSTATMRASAHFDGRCAGLAADDIAAVSYSYPGSGGPVPPTPTPYIPPPPTNTPTPTPTFTATPTFTPPPIHDSVVAPLRAKNVTITAGHTVVSRKVRVKVTNADILPFPETTAHTIKLYANNGDCPAGTIAKLPDFNGDTAGEQDSVQLPGGKSKSATVTLNIDSAAFAGPNQQVPMRCSLVFEVVASQPSGSIDPTLANNIAFMELNVVDKNKTDAAPDPVLKSLAPVKVTIPQGRATVTTKVRPQLGRDANGAPLDQSATLAVSGNCPANAVSAVTPAQGAGANGSTNATVVLTINSAAFTTAHAKSPARCGATLSATGTSVDPQAASRTSTLVIDVVDKNDF